MFVTAFRSILSSVRIRNSVCTCLDGFKAGSVGFVFPREFSSLFRVSRVQLGLLRSFSCGDLRWLRDVTGKAPLQSLDSWLRYGFGTALDPLRWLVWLWESSGPASRSALRAFERAEFRSARELQEGREERDARASSFQLSGLDAAHRRLIESDCPYGAELHPCPWFSCKAFSMEKRITFDPCIKTFIKFTHL